jgi:hypothetical protein
MNIEFLLPNVSAEIRDSILMCWRFAVRLRESKLAVLYLKVMTQNYEAHHVIFSILSLHLV